MQAPSRVFFKEFWLHSQLQSCTYIWLPPAGNPLFQKSHVIKQVISISSSGSNELISEMSLIKNQKYI